MQPAIQLQQPAPRSPLLREALAGGRRGFVAAAVFSAFANVLMLVSPVSILQSYTRVLTSASHESLLAP